MEANINFRISSTDRKSIARFYEHLGQKAPEPTLEEKLNDVSEALADTAAMTAENAISLDDVFAAILELAEDVADLKEKFDDDDR